LRQAAEELEYSRSAPVRDKARDRSRDR